MPTWLTVADLSGRLNRPQSTIRSWRDTHRDFVPEQRNEAGRLVYPLERITEIAALYGQRLRPREVQAELLRRHGEASAASDDAPDMLNVILAELRALRADLAELRAVVDQLARHLLPREE